jgi:hypothetical protein
VQLETALQLGPEFLLFLYLLLQLLNPAFELVTLIRSLRVAARKGIRH